MPIDVQALLAGAEAAASKIDIPTALAILGQVAQALPAIEAGIVKAAPYVEAIGAVLAGQTPTDEQWQALDARLDAGSDALQAAAQDEGGQS